MAKAIQTSKLGSLKGAERQWVYNGLDCCVTREVFDVLNEQLDSQTRATYEFSKALQGPVLEMRIRGVKIDLMKREALIDEYRDLIEGYHEALDDIVIKGLEVYGFNWQSPKDVHNLFYDILELPVVRRFGRPTADRAALERLERHEIARPIITLMKAIRDADKRSQMLETDIDSDGRIRTSYNIAGTDTGRFSSSVSEFGTGGNLQNIENRLRRIFIADDGMKLAYLDAAQGESRVVGAIEWNLFQDGTYLDSCEGGDLHTTVSKLCWPELPWTGDIKADKAIAERPYYRDHSYRDMCKKLGHGTNYAGQARTMSDQTRIPLEIVQSFQSQYFMAYPAHMSWHRWVSQTLQKKGMITNLTGRRRQFWDRLDAPETLRAAIAFSPQGSLADIVNKGMLNVWRSRIAQLLLQCHDAVLVQYPEDKEEETIPKLKKLLEHKIELAEGREFVIPYDCKVGWNWANYSSENPNGLKDYSPGERRRKEEVPVMDKRIRRAY